MNDSEKQETASGEQAATETPTQQPGAETPIPIDVGAGPAQPTEAGESDLQTQLDDARNEINTLRDQALRAHAEMDNVRRRAERDVQSAHKFGLERFMSDLLEVVDSLDRGMLAADTEQVSVEQLKEGTELTHRLLDKVLERHGLKEVSPAGEAFNPEFHEALSMLPTTEAAPNTVVQVVQKGYLLNDRLVRPARVIVAQQP